MFVPVKTGSGTIIMAYNEKTGGRTMDFTNRPMKGYVLVDDTGMKTQKDFDYWIGLALDFNKKAKSSKKKKK